MLKFCRSNQGAEIALGMEGDAQEIEVFGTRLYNFGIVGGRVNYMSKKFGYVLTTPKKLKEGLARIKMWDLKQKFKDAPKEERRDNLNWKTVVKETSDFIENLPLEHFVSPKRSSDKLYHTKCDIQNF